MDSQWSSSLVRAATATALLGTTGCSAAKTPPPTAPASVNQAGNDSAPANADPDDPVLKLAPVRVQLLDGLVSGVFEGAAPTEVECGAEESGERWCEFEIVAAVDETGRRAGTVSCSASTANLPVGKFIYDRLGSGGLKQPPTTATRQVGAGVATWFSAEYTDSLEGERYDADLKVAAYSAAGFTVTCADRYWVPRDRFVAATQAYFDSMELGTHPDGEVVYELGYRNHRGSQGIGRKYTFVRRKPGEDGEFIEEVSHFTLVTNDRHWHVSDTMWRLVRDRRGALKDAHQSRYVDGDLVQRMELEPTRRGLRIKSETHSGSHTAELRPERPVTTELWLAAAIKRLAHGSNRSLSYAFANTVDGVPTLRYAQLRRLAAGVLAEQIVDAPRKHRKSDEPFDRLTVNDDGVVAKQVFSNRVAELIFSQGELPAVAARSGQKGAKR